MGHTRRRIVRDGRSHSSVDATTAWTMRRSRTACTTGGFRLPVKGASRNVAHGGCGATVEAVHAAGCARTPSRKGVAEDEIGTDRLCRGRLGNRPRVRRGDSGAQVPDLAADRADPAARLFDVAERGGHL